MIYVYREAQKRNEEPVAVVKDVDALEAACALLLNFPGERFFTYGVLPVPPLIWRGWAART